MSAPKHPVYTFRVNLQTVDFLSFLIPDRYQSDQDLGLTEGENHKFNRSTWLPGLTGGDNIVKNHDDTFTVYGMQAQYLKDTYTTGENPVLTLVTP